MFTLLNKVKKRDWNYAAAEVYRNKRRFRKRIKHIRWFTIILLHLHYYLDLYNAAILPLHFWNIISKILILQQSFYHQQQGFISICYRLDLKTKVEYQHFWKIYIIIYCHCYMLWNDILNCIGCHPGKFESRTCWISRGLIRSNKPSNDNLILTHALNFTKNMKCDIVFSHILQHKD